MRDSQFRKNFGILLLHQTRGTPSVLYINDCCTDSYAFPSPKSSSDFIIRRNGSCIFSEYTIQGRDNNFAANALVFLQVAKNLGQLFRSAVFFYHYQY